MVIEPAAVLAGAELKPGDVAVFKHHVDMIEAYDKGIGQNATVKISTVDGNVGLHPENLANAVSGYAGDAKTIAGLHGGLRVVWRPGLESLGGTPATEPTTTNNAGKELLNQIDSACHQVIELYRGLHLPGAVADGKTVAAMADNSPH